jgi:putative FmdB family regulatory protein
VPTYGYECTKCHEEFEVFQRITEDPLTIHDGCGGELRKLMYPVGIVFKGAGFYVNDYAKNGAKAAVNGINGSDAKAESKSEAKAEVKTEAKPETKTEPKSEPVTASSK